MSQRREPLSMMKQLKCLSEPMRYSFTDAVIDSNRQFFPYINYWHGDYEWDYPIVDDRKAGYFPRSTFSAKHIVRGTKNAIEFKLPRSCFETAPSTTIPCSNKYDCYGCNCLSVATDR